MILIIESCVVGSFGSALAGLPGGLGSILRFNTSVRSPIILHMTSSMAVVPDRTGLTTQNEHDDLQRGQAIYEGLSFQVLTHSQFQAPALLQPILSRRVAW